MKKVNTTRHDNKSFVNCVTHQTVVMFYHLRRIQQSPDRFKSCVARHPDMKHRLDKLVRRVEPSPTETKKPQKRVLLKKIQLPSLYRWMKTASPRG